MLLRRAMSISEQVASLEARAQAAHITIAEILREARVDRSTWTRWRNDRTSPRMDNWQAVNEAADRLIASRTVAV
jgi:hypothetical protein